MPPLAARRRVEVTVAAPETAASPVGEAVDRRSLVASVASLLLALPALVGS